MPERPDKICGLAFHELPNRVDVRGCVQAPVFMKATEDKTAEMIYLHQTYRKMGYAVLMI